jgi:hypothetical protein
VSDVGLFTGNVKKGNVHFIKGVSRTLREIKDATILSSQIELELTELGKAMLKMSDDANNTIRAGEKIDAEQLPRITKGWAAFVKKATGSFDQQSEMYQRFVELGKQIDGLRESCAKEPLNAKAHITWLRSIARISSEVMQLCDKAMALTEDLARAELGVGQRAQQVKRII